MTEKLFENDAYLWECEAVVTACKPCKNGFAVELDKTVFFPEGGGQLSDRFLLREGRVLPLRTWRKKAGAFCTFAISRLPLAAPLKPWLTAWCALTICSSTAANIFCLTRRGSCLAQIISAFICLEYIV